MVKLSKRGKRVWATFTFDGDGFETLQIKGSWNDWEPEPMKRKKNGDFYIVKILPAGENFEFGYLTEEGGWIFDETLPTVETPFGSRNSVLNT